nr:ubiquitin-activating enzyme E1 1-like [Tanacetum cinerariifolium]
MSNKINRDSKSCPTHFSATDCLSKSTGDLLRPLGPPMRLGGLFTVRVMLKEGDGSARRGQVLKFDGERGVVQDVDKDCHSRQLAVYGHETMRKLFGANVLISGMQALGANTPYV